MKKFFYNQPETEVDLLEILRDFFDFSEKEFSNQPKDIGAILFLNSADDWLEKKPGFHRTVSERLLPEEITKNIRAISSMTPDKVFILDPMLLCVTAIAHSLKISGNGNVSSLYRGSFPQIIKGFKNSAVGQAIEEVVILKQKKEFFEEEIDAVSKEQEEVINKEETLQKTLGYYLFCSCPEFIVHDEQEPYEYLLVTKEDDENYFISFSDEGDESGVEKKLIDPRDGAIILRLQQDLKRISDEVATLESSLVWSLMELEKSESKILDHIAFLEKHFNKNPIPDCEIFAVAIDPTDEAPCALVLSTKEHETEVPKEILNILILSHLRKEELLSTEMQGKLGVKETIEKISAILADL